VASNTPGNNAALLNRPGSRERKVALRRCSEALKGIWPQLDMGVPRGVSVLTDLARDLRWLLNQQQRIALWHSNRDASSFSVQNVRLDRKKAKAFFDGVDFEDVNSTIETRPRREDALFNQLYNVAKSWSASQYQIRQNQRSFKVNFNGEAGVDGGGLYRECLTEISKELMSPSLGVFIPSPNSKQDTGRNRDTFVPAPLPESSRARQTAKDKLRFLGRLMGAAVRSGNFLQLQISPFVWKEIARETVSKDDILGVDVLSFGMAEAMIKADKDGFEDLYDGTFTGLRSDGRLCPLVPYGNSIRVSWKERLVYSQLLSAFKTREFSEQISCIREGLAEVIPLSFLMMHRGSELEIAVCGKNTVDVALLKRHTTYEGYSAFDSVITLFWTVLENRFDNELRMKYLQFVWGRSRLPTNESMWESNMKITRMHRAGNPDDALPLSHTCFFQLDLPQYSSEEVMYRQLKTAIENCSLFDMG